MTRRGTQEGTSVFPRTLHEPEDCRAVSEVLSRVGDKWTVLVVWTLGGGSKRFNELRKALGSISQRMLTLTLRALERDGLVKSTVDHDDRRNLIATLTSRGRAIVEKAIDSNATSLRAALAPLSANELETLMSLLQRLRQGFLAVREDPRSKR